MAMMVWMGGQMADTVLYWMQQKKYGCGGRLTCIAPRFLGAVEMVYPARRERHETVNRDQELRCFLLEEIMTKDFADLDRVLDGESWDWISDNYPPLAESVAKAVAQGISPEDISRRVVQRLGAHRIALAQRCESAARWLKGGE